MLQGGSTLSSPLSGLVLPPNFSNVISANICKKTLLGKIKLCDVEALRSGGKILWLRSIQLLFREVCSILHILQLNVLYRGLRGFEAMVFFFFADGG